jgi:hypothetical protein
MIPFSPITLARVALDLSRERTNTNPKKKA